MDYKFLSGTPLFQEIAKDEIEQILSCLHAREKTYQKDEIIYHAGDRITEIGFVESGSVNIVVNFFSGKSHIFGHANKGAIFAENYALLADAELICDVVATEASTILFLDVNKLFTSCKSSCSFHQRLIQNLLRISAQKGLTLTSRMMHTAPRALRDRLISYLSEQAIANNSAHFTIPYNRQQLADYLGVDRSAMSHELSKMQQDGWITFRKNEFTIKTDFFDL